MDAAERFEALLAAGKDNALLRFSLGMHYLKAGDAPRAVSHLREAVRQDPKYSAAWKILGKALCRDRRGRGSARRLWERHRGGGGARRQAGGARDDGGSCGAWTEDLAAP